MKQQIENYINAYNNFDIDGMLVDLAADFVFHNITDGEIDLIVAGKDDFKKQATLAANLFTVRHQEMISIEIENDKAMVKINYTAVLAKDLSDTIKKGDELQLKGTSIFQFKANKIIKIEDIS